MSKKAFIEVVSLQYLDSNAELSLMVEASDVAVGAVLQQRTNEEWLPVSFYSKKASRSCDSLFYLLS